MKWKRDDIGYNPAKFAQHMQYREMHDQRGCRFIDTCYTLNMRLVRGFNLVYALSVEHYRQMKPDGDLKSKVHVDKMIFLAIGTPGIYQRRLTALNITVAETVNIQRWPLDQANPSVTLDDVVRRMADSGVFSALVDDAFEYAQRFALDVTAPLPPGWTIGDATDVLNYAQGHTEAPPSLFPGEADVCPRSPYLPWQMEFENVVQFEFWHWNEMEMPGLRREYGSKIIAAQNSGKGRQPRPSRGILDKYNPWLIDIKKNGGFAQLSQRHPPKGRQWK
ncbi:hypothetical protein R3P38DRAFT_2746054, partial [Favolaschia claudopus]